MFSPHPRLFVEMAAVIRNINGLTTSAVHNSGRWRCGMKRDDVALVEEPSDFLISLCIASGSPFSINNSSLCE